MSTIVPRYCTNVGTHYSLSPLPVHICYHHPSTGRPSSIRSCSQSSCTAVFSMVNATTQVRRQTISSTNRICGRRLKRRHNPPVRALPASHYSEASYCNSLSVTRAHHHPQSPPWRAPQTHGAHALYARTASVSKRGSVFYPPKPLRRATARPGGLEKLV